MIEWALRRKMVPERMVEAIMALYVETRTRVKTVAAKSEGPLREITELEIEAALKGMKKGKAAGPSGLKSELLQGAGSRESGNKMVKTLF